MADLKHGELIMKTKIVYVLVSSEDDLFWEQCLISVMSARYHMPNANIILVCDNITKDTFCGVRHEIESFFSKVIVVPFDDSVDKIRRSRIIKVTLRRIINGDFLYIDCDTLITQPIDSIDEIDASVAAVLDGHCLFKNHPMKEYFLSQNKILNYSIDKVVEYFNGGVMYVKDDKRAYELYDYWYKNYQLSCSKKLTIDEPALSKSNIELGNLIQELDGTWNCQVRFGALYLAKSKILHFCSKKNMPVCILSNRDYLQKVKAKGPLTEHITDYIKNWKKTMCQGMVTCIGVDASYALSQQYEIGRKEFVFNQMKDSLYLPKFKIVKLLLSLRNSFIGVIIPAHLSMLLYKEKFGRNIQNEPEYDFNKMLHKLAFNSRHEEWSILADKLAVRQYVESKKLGNILPTIYNSWDSGKDIDFKMLPIQFVLKCNHDNGSTITVTDKYSVDIPFIKNFYSKRVRKRFGILTAEPHYKTIKRKIFAEEYLENDKIFSDSLVSYKFFSFYGKTDYCQVIYDSKHHENQKCIVYNTHGWIKEPHFVVKNRGNVDVPLPKTLDKMLDVVFQLASTLPFCRVDLYEIGDRVIFSEMTFMPGAGRMNNFSQDFLSVLGKQLKKTEDRWKLL
jgi:hypothetical protein